MAPLLTRIALFLGAFSLLAITASASKDSVDRIPLGGSLFKLDAHALSVRQSGGDLGTDCGGDPDCTTTTYGCACGFVDGSWMPPRESTSPPPPPPPPVISDSPPPPPPPAGPLPGSCTSDADCKSTQCNGGSATCKAVGMGQSSG